MTGTNDKLRSLFLTALMVFSVFAGTVALSGAAAAANSSVAVDQAVEYTDNSGNNEVEVVFNQTVSSSVTVDRVLVDGSTGVVGASGATDSQRSIVSLNGDVTPNRNLTLDLSVDGNEVIVQDVTSTASSVTEGQGSSRTNAVNTYLGEPVAIISDSDDETFQLGNAIEADTGSNSRVAVVNNNNFDTGSTVRVSFSSTNEFFNVSDLGLSASTDTSIASDEDVEVDIEINRGAAAIVNLTDSNGDEVAQTTVTTDALETTTANLGTVDAGNYTAYVVDNQTGKTVNTSTIVVSEAADTEAGFTGNGVFTEEVGDVASINVTFSNTDQATLTVGSRDSNYLAVANVTDGDGNGYATVEFNSYVAGSTNDTALFDVEDSDDSVELQGGGAGQQGAFVDTSKNASESLLAAVDYQMNVTAGHVYANSSDYRDNDPDQLGTLGLRSRSTDNMAIWTAPRADGIRGLSASDVYGDIGSSITQANTVANEDWVVHQIQVSGIEGVLNAENSNTTTALFQQINGSADIVQELHLNVEESQGGVNADPTALTLNASNTAVIADPTNDTYFVAVDTEEVTEISNNTEYTANFTVAGGSNLTDSAETVTGEFTIEPRDVTINGGNDVTVRSASGQTISGTTNLAPGTNVTVNIRSTDTASPFLANPETEVQPDGTFTVTEDFSSVSPGTNLSLQARVQGNDIGESVDATVGERPTGSVTLNAQTTDGTTVTVASVTMSEGGFVAIHMGSASGEVIGSSEYLSAGSQENVEITLDQPLDSDATLVAMPHQDTNGNQVYEFSGGSTDAPYTTSAGSPVTDSAEITVQVDTPEPTETATLEPTETATLEPTETDTPEDTPADTPADTPEDTPQETTEPAETTTEPAETTMAADTTEPPAETTTAQGPGFGATIAVLALIAAALLAVRRND